MKSSKKLLIFISVVALLAYIGTQITLTVYEEADTIGVNVSTFEELADRFVELAQNKGALYAFGVLKRAALPENTDLHLLGHFVGDELYKQKGVNGIQNCTQDFRNACSHTIVLGMLAEFGGGALPQIRDACAKAPGGPGAYMMCFHGLGHGVFAGYGYEIQKTIDFCKQTGTKEFKDREYIECFGGAIMELTGGGGHDPNLWEISRDKYLSEPLFPCLSTVVPNELKSICLTYLTPEIWSSAGIELGIPDPSKFEEAFNYCSVISSSELRYACYGGFGKEFVAIVILRDIRDIDDITDGQLGIIYDWCKKAAIDEGIAACSLSALDSIFWGGENDPDISFRYCSLINKDNAQIGSGCYASLAAQIYIYIPQDSVREKLCSNLPKKVQSLCHNSIINDK